MPELKWGVVLGLFWSVASSSAKSDPSTTFNLDAPHVARQLIVKFHSKGSAQKSALLQRTNGREVYTFKSRGAVLIEFADAASPADLFEVAKNLSRDRSVEYVEANTIVFADGVLPNDPRLPEVYGLNNDGGHGGTFDADIDAPEAWAIATDSKRVVIGVIDTGIDMAHEDLKANVWRNPGESGVDLLGRRKESNGVDDDRNGYVDDFRGWDFVNGDNDPSDDNGHGTHCAGIIGATGDNGVGIAGVNWSAAIVGIKFLDAQGGGTLDNAIKAVEYATTIGVDLTNNSWGGPRLSETLKDAVDASGRAGQLFVAAAGNFQSNIQIRKHYPASFGLANVIAVAATDRRDLLASTSNYGKESVHLAAPGSDVLSLLPDNQYGLKSGTSMATPYVSGALALMRAGFPWLSAMELKSRLLQTIDPLDSLEDKTISGGRLNLYSALEDDRIAPGSIRNLAVSGMTLNSFSVTFLPAGDDGEHGEAMRYWVRIANQPIVTLADWDRATPVRIATRKAGGEVEMDIVQLPFNSRGFFAARALDNLSQVGPISQSLEFSVAPSQIIAIYPGSSMEGITSTGRWGVEAASTGEAAFSDSPGGYYDNDTDAYLQLPPIPVSEPNLVMTFDTKFETERNFDVGTVELSRDGGVKWLALQSYSGSSDWLREEIDLTPFVSRESDSILLRFHIRSDSTLYKDGWYIKNIAIHGPLP